MCRDAFSALDEDYKRFKAETVREYATGRLILALNNPEKLSAIDYSYFQAQCAKKKLILAKITMYNSLLSMKKKNVFSWFDVKRRSNSVQNSYFTPPFVNCVCGQDHRVPLAPNLVALWPGHLSLSEIREYDYDLFAKLYATFRPYGSFMRKYMNFAKRTLTDCEKLCLAEWRSTWAGRRFADVSELGQGVVEALYVKERVFFREHTRRRCTYPIDLFIRQFIAFPNEANQAGRDAHTRNGTHNFYVPPREARGVRRNRVRQIMERSFSVVFTHPIG